MRRLLVSTLLGLALLSGGPAGAKTAEQPPAAAAGAPSSAPQVNTASPGPSDRFEDELQAIRIMFEAPVSGVSADDLTVNGAAATDVTGEGAGPYHFSGYPMPSPGEVQVVLSPGGIRGDPSGVPFEGHTWTFRFFLGAKDDDGDGLTNAEEIVQFLDPMSSDTDQDGLPDPYEHSHPCLDAGANQAHPRGYSGEPLPGDADADNDGVSDLDEFRRGADPCQP